MPTMKTNTSEKRFTCEVCKLSFSKNSKFVIHMRLHKGERPFVCDVGDCTKMYTNSSHLIRHKRMCHENHTTKYTCAFMGCEKEYLSTSALWKHYNRFHELDKMFECSHCKKFFHKEHQLHEHQYEHTGEKAFSCDLCDAKFETLLKLKKHKRNHKTYTCKCSAVFHRWSNYLSHQHECSELTPKCPLCNKQFVRKTNLRAHMTTHQENSDKPMFMCEYEGCMRMYLYKKNLQQHVNIHHKSIKKRIQCLSVGCNKTFSKMRYLNHHMQTVHLNVVKENKPRKPRKDKGIPHIKVVDKLVGVMLCWTEEETESDNDSDIKVKISELEECEPVAETASETVETIVGI